MILRVLKWIGLVLMAGLATLVLTNCTMLGLNYASLEVDNKAEARPRITAANVAQWEAGREALKSEFETHVYGPWPDGLAVSIGETTVADPDYLNGKGSLEQTEITLGTGAGARSFLITVAWPSDTTGPVPVILSQTFSSTCYVFSSPDILGPDGQPCTETDFDGFAGFMVQNIFGEYIAKAPLDRYLDAGYAYGSFQASAVISDSNDAAMSQLAALRDSDGIESTGAIMLWSYAFSAIIDHLETDPRADLSRIAVMGHSRHGKSTLVAAVWDPRIDLVISHQSGFGGAALNRSKTGEGLGGVTGAKGGFGGGYPYWFAPRYADYAGDLASIPVDQHQLLALIAPRPVLLGNGRRDVWSDPNSTFRAAEGADPVWELYGVSGLDQSGMRDFVPTAELVYYLRPGGHSIVERDIDAFLAFLDAHFSNGASDLKASARP